MNAPSPQLTAVPSRFAHDYKRSESGSRAVQESERARMLRISPVIAASADQVRSLLGASALPATYRVESVIGRAEQALAVWVSLKAF